MEKEQEQPAAAGPVDCRVRPLAGRQKGRRVIGDKRTPLQRLTVHWIHATNGRMYWCNCMPCFRVGDKVHCPSGKRPKGVKGRAPRLRSFLTELLAHA